MPALPNLLVIGAAKCGTSSLHQYLGLHPEVEMSRPKELKLFTNDDWEDRVGWYEAQFAGTTAVRGESSPGYTMCPYLPCVAERVHRLIPEARLIYVVRDPVERALAQYVEFVALGLEHRGASAALGDVADPENPYICSSRYATQLQRFLHFFPSDQTLVLDHAELLHERGPTLRRLFGFLGVDESFETDEFRQLHNVGREKVRYNRLGRWLVGRGIFTKRGGPIRRGPLMSPLRQALGQRIDVSVPSAVRARLAEVFRPEVARLGELTGRDFSAWPVMGG